MELEMGLIYDIPAMPSIAMNMDTLSDEDVAALADLSARVEELAVAMTREMAKRGHFGVWRFRLSAIEISVVEADA